MKEKYEDYNGWSHYSSIYYKDVNEIQSSANKHVNGDILLREYMGILGLTDKDLEGSINDIRAKIRDNKISKIIE